MNLEYFHYLLLSMISSLSSQQQNVTIQLCCQTGEYFNMTQYKCQSIPNDVDIKWSLKIKYPNKTQNEINISKNVIHKVHLPCEKPEAMLWQINETIDMNVVNNMEYCFTPFHLKGSKNYALVQLDCHLELHYFLAFKHEIIYFFSGFLLIPTLIIYIVLKPLNENLMGFIHFYLNMIIVYWLNVLGFEAWKNFNDSNEELDDYEKKKRFRYDSIYVCTISAITTAPTVWRNFSDIFKYCGKYEKSKSCVMLTYLILYTDIYFAPAVMLILMVNFFIFFSVSWKVYSLRRNFATSMYKERFVRENATICLRLFVLMGPQWIFMYLFKDYKYIEILIFGMGYIESLLIFILFVLKKNVLKLLIEKIKQ